MFKISAALSLSTIFFVGASATPLRRASCNPNAQGNPIAIQNAATGLEWNVFSMPTSMGAAPFAGSTLREWNILQPIESPPSYFIQFAGTAQVTVIDAGELVLGDEANPPQANQIFTITCDSCGTDASPGNVLAEGCVISPVGVDSCISIGPDAGVGALHNLGCTPSAPTPSEVYTLLT